MLCDPRTSTASGNNADERVGFVVRVTPHDPRLAWLGLHQLGRQCARAR
jgi:hypothetical protein